MFHLKMQEIRAKMKLDRWLIMPIHFLILFGVRENFIKISLKRADKQQERVIVLKNCLTRQLILEIT